MTTEQTIIDKCKQFSVKADYLETKAFNDISYREMILINYFNNTVLENRIEQFRD